MVSPTANPLLQNDPSLVLFARVLQLSPFEFALLGFVSLPIVVFIWSALTGTLYRDRNIATGQGLISWINAYLLIIPILDFEIFKYYDVYADKIPKLIDTHVLTGPQSGILYFFSTDTAEWLSVGFILISLCIAIIATQWPRLRKNARTTWLSKGNSPRLISYYFYIVLFGVHGSIVLNWLLRHIAIWKALNQALNPDANTYSPDKMFGLSALADLIWYSYGVLLTITILVAVWLVGAKLTNRKEQMHKHPGEVAAVVILLAAGPLGFLAPLLGSHTRMTGAKEREQAVLSDKIRTVSEEIRSSSTSTPMTQADLSAKAAVLNAESQLYKFVDDCSTWPISAGMISALLGFLNPVFLLLLKKFVPWLPEE